MCKLFGISSVAGWNRKTLEATLLAAQSAFSGEKDGFGYAVRTSRGLYGERYVNPNDFTGVGGAQALDDYLDPISDAIDFEADTTGRLGKLKGGLIVHGRTSTNDLDIENTHPFIKKQWALAHNGIVTYDGPDRHKRGVCDSEDILNSFVYGDGLTEMSKFYTGYAAVLALPPKWGFIAYRDDKAPLYVCMTIGNGVGERVAYAFATKPEHLYSILKKAEIRHTRPMKMKDEHAILIKGDRLEASVKVETHDGPGYRVTSYSEEKATGVPAYGGSSTYAAQPSTYSSNTHSRVITGYNRGNKTKKQSSFGGNDWSGYGAGQS